MNFRQYLIDKKEEVNAHDVKERDLAVEPSSH